MKIGKHNSDERVIVIAEIGNNHEGDFGLAKTLISKAADAGADVVKFQTIIPERLVSVSDRDRISQLKKFQFSQDQFQQLQQHALESGVEFLSTPFDIDAVTWLNDLVPAWKIASCDNDFYPLLDRVAATGKPVIVSMGLGHHEAAAQLSEFFDSAWKRHNVSSELAFLHCVVSYPTPTAEAGLAQIGNLRLPGVTPGYSDHTIGIKAAELAIAAGARIIEKHFTIDKNHSEFRDHQLSADPTDLREMVEAIRNAELLLGPKHIGARECEEVARDAVRRSLTATVDLSIGAIVEMDNLSWVRPGTGLRPGQEAQVLGKKLVKPVLAGGQILPHHVE